MKKKPHPFGLVIRTVEPGRGSTEHFHIYADVVFLPPGAASGNYRNTSWNGRYSQDDEIQHIQDLYGFRISSQGGGHRPDGRTWVLKQDHGLYAWEWSYVFGDHHEVRLAQAKAVVRVLSSTDRAMDRLKELEGEPASFGAYVNRVARAIGASYILIPGEPYARSGNYADMDLRERTLGEAIGQIDYIVEGWTKRIEWNAKKAEQEARQNDEDYARRNGTPLPAVG